LRRLQQEVAAWTSEYYLLSMSSPTVLAARVNAFQRQYRSAEAFSRRHADAFSAGRSRFARSQQQQQQQQHWASVAVPLSSRQAALPMERHAARTAAYQCIAGFGRSWTCTCWRLALSFWHCSPSCWPTTPRYESWDESRGKRIATVRFHYARCSRRSNETFSPVSSADNAENNYKRNLLSAMDARYLFDHELYLRSSLTTMRVGLSIWLMTYGTARL